MPRSLESIRLSDLASKMRLKPPNHSIPEGRANEAFKTVRNRLKKYSGSDIIGYCVEALNRPDALTEERRKRYPPWLMLLLIKWTLLYGEFNSRPLKTFSRTDFEKLVYRLHDYGQ
jgi:hypothetical protein